MPIGVEPRDLEKVRTMCPDCVLPDKLCELENRERVTESDLDRAMAAVRSTCRRIDDLATSFMVHVTGFGRFTKDLELLAEKLELFMERKRRPEYVTNGYTAYRRKTKKKRTRQKK